MPSCCAPNCRNGYSGAPYPPGVSRHKFPVKNQELLAKWTRALCRENFIPTTSTVVCSEHFRPSDFITQSQHNRLSRRKEGELTHKRLKPDAVPSVFKIPAHLIREPPKERPTKCVQAEQRRDATKRRQMEAEAEAMAESQRLDSLSSLNELLEKLK